LDNLILYNGIDNAYRVTPNVKMNREKSGETDCQIEVYLSTMWSME
jgi:hypothetical protein